MKATKPFVAIPDRDEESPLHPAEVPFDMSQADARATELAKLKPLDYEQARNAEAKTLGIRVSVLDAAVNAQRPKPTESETDDPFEAVEPWGDPVHGATLLAEVQSAIYRFCVLPEHSAPLMAVWILHAWTHDTADISPILAFVSPEKRCGKTTALSAIGALTPRAMHNVNVTTSVLFRVVEKFCPTVLIDEADTYLADNDELRGILNGGHNRMNAYVWRSVGDDHEPKRFKVWAPKCIAMIGKLPDTLEDRALVVPLRRKQSGETVERFRADRLTEFLPIRRRAQRWADDNSMRLRDMDPAIPAELNDRAQDNARAICAIADLVGGIWPGLVRASLVGLAAQSDDDPQSAGVLLLRDIADVLDGRKGGQIKSADLCENLCALEESPWAEWRRGNPIVPRSISKILKPYDIHPRRTNGYRYYAIEDFQDSFDRYLPDTPLEASPSVTNRQAADNATEKGDASGDASKRVTQASVTDLLASPYPSPNSGDFSTCYQNVTQGDANTEGLGERAPKSTSYEGEF